MKKSPGPRILFLDIETAPLQSYHWSIWQENIGLEQIDLEWSILSFCAKWLGEKQVYYRDTGGRGRARVRDDVALLHALHKLLDEADIVVAHNGQAFDVKKINARMLMCGLKPYSPIKIIDTMLVAKKHFAFTSNRLAWLSKHITPDTKKSEHKRFPGFELWSECLKDNRQAWAEMKKYNIQDVLALEELYLKLRPWTEGHPNVATYSESVRPACPKCGGEKLQMRGRACTQTGKYQRFQCQDCGGWARSRYKLKDFGKAKGLLVN